MANADPVIPLPPVHGDIQYGAPIPPLPSTPPNDRDIFEANRFHHLVNTNFEISASNDAGVIQASKYYFRVMKKVEPAPAPDWATEFKEQIFNRLEETNQKIEDAKTEILEQVEAVERRLVLTQRLLYKRENQSRSKMGPLVEIPFPDGTMPWGETVDGPNNTQVTLPNIDSLNAVEQLTEGQLYAYYTGYKGAAPHARTARDTRIRGILEEIGVK